MPQKRANPDKILTPAEKQARHRAKKTQDADRLTGLLYQLERAVWDAADRGNGLADAVKAGNVESLLENLTAHFEAAGKAAGKPDA